MVLNHVIWVVTENGFQERLVILVCLLNLNLIFILGFGFTIIISALAFSTLIITSHICQLQPIIFWNIKSLVIFKPISRMHPNGVSIQSSDPPIIIFHYDTPAIPPMAAPSATTLMTAAASSYSSTTRSYLLDPYSITFHIRFIRGSLINYITVICKCRRVGHSHSHRDNVYMHLYGHLYGS